MNIVRVGPILSIQHKYHFFASFLTEKSNSLPSANVCNTIRGRPRRVDVVVNTHSHPNRRGSTLTTRCVLSSCNSTRRGSRAGSCHAKHIYINLFRNIYIHEIRKNIENRFLFFFFLTSSPDATLQTSVVPRCLINTVSGHRLIIRYIGNSSFNSENILQIRKKLFFVKNFFFSESTHYNCCCFIFSHINHQIN